MSTTIKVGEPFYACSERPRSCPEDEARLAFERAEKHYRIKLGPMRRYEDERVSGYEAEVVEVEVQP